MADIRIGICDDQMEAALELNTYVEELKQERKYQYKIDIFDSGEALLQHAKEIAVVFLDIEMRGLDGIETGMLLHQRNPKCIIIMATGREERYKEAFRIQAFRFITKPFDRKEIYEALEAAFEVQRGEEELELFSKRTALKIKQKEICYIKACNGDTEFLVGNQILRKDISLNELEEILDEKMFFRVHRQCIVNMEWIENYHKGNILIKDQCIVVARRKRKEFERKYIEYDIKYRRR